MWHINIAPMLCCLFLSACFYPVENFEARADMTSSLDLSIPLDVAVAASNPQRFAVRGKYIQIDPGSTGQANLRINSVSDTPRLAYPGQQFSPGDFTDLYFDYIAQPGKFLHVVYGEAPDILSGGNRTTVDPPISRTVFIDTAIGPAAVNTTFIGATDNVNGVKILSGELSTFMTSAGKATCGIFIGASGHIAAMNSTGDGVTILVDSKSISQIYIPPGIPVGWFAVVPNLGDRCSVIMNYEILA